MTDGNPRPDEEPAPPTTTGRSEEADAHADELAPPFIPGSPGPEPTPDAETGGDEPDAGAFPFDTGWDGDDGLSTEGRDEADDFPMEAFDIEGGEASWLEEAGPVGETAEGTAYPDYEPAPEPADGPAGESEATENQGMHAARDLATRLEEMARRLRDQGPEAARTELESPDRFTALLAGLLAGYLAGKE